MFMGLPVRAVVMATFIVLVVPPAEGQTEPTRISGRTKRIVHKMEGFERLKGERVGRAGRRPEEYDVFVDLQRSASPSELEALTDHPCPIVCGYSFWALSSVENVDLLPIILRHISDTAQVVNQFGSVVRHELIGDFFIKVAEGWHSRGVSSLDSVQLALLDSVLLFVPNALEARSDILYEADPNPSRYGRIRELVLTEHDQYALLALARYRKVQDIPLIVSHCERAQPEYKAHQFAHEAILEFPHPDFMPLLERNLRASFDDRGWSMSWPPMYRAIASYRNPWALELLDLPFTHVQDSIARGYHLDFLFTAVLKANDPIYDALLWKLWAEEDRVNKSVFQRLSDLEPERAFKIMERELLNARTLSFSSGRYWPEESDTLLAVILERVLDQDSEFGLDMIRKNIRDADVPNFEVFTRKAAEIRDSSFVEPLFARLQSESNPYFFLKAAEALIVYQDPAIDMRLLVEQEKKPDLLETWAGKELDALLKKNGIK